MPPPTQCTHEGQIEALEILHAHGHGPFPGRLFKASRLLFADACHSFEMYEHEGQAHQSIAHSDIPFPEGRLHELLCRIGELVPTENPIFPALLRGEQHPLRISDFLTQRQFRRTNLYHDIFKPFGLKYQMVIPVFTATHAGGLTINRGTRDFCAEEVQAAVTFARHLALAHHTELLLRLTAPSQAALRKADFLPLRRRGLTRRECEVLWWIKHGKRDHEIASILGIALRTASHHVENILAKLKVETRTAAATVALRLWEE